MLEAKGYPLLFYTGGWWIACLMTMPCCKRLLRRKPAGGGWFRLGLSLSGRLWSTPGGQVPFALIELIELIDFLFEANRKSR